MAFTPVKQITVDEKVKKAGFTPLGTVIQDKPKSKGFIGGAISELGSDLAGAGKAIGGLAKAAVNVPIGFGQAVAGGLTFNKELTEKGIQKATAPVRGTGQLIKTAAIDVPKNVGQGLGQFIAGGLQQGAGLISGNEELKEKGEVAQRGGTIQGLKGIGQGASFVPNVAGQALGGLTGSLSESLEKNLSGGEALGRAFMSAGERAALTKGIQKIFNKPRGEKGKPGIREKLTLEERQIKAATEQAKISPERGKELVKSASKSSADDLAVRPTQIVGKQLNTTVTKLDNIKNQIGKKIGNFTKKIGADKAQVKTRGISNKLESGLKSSNVSIKNGKLNFANSDLKGLPSTSKNLLQDQYILMRNSRLNPRDLLSNTRDLGNRLYAGAKNAEFAGAEKFFEQIRSMSSKALKKQYPQMADDFAQYSQLSNGLDDITRLAGQEGLKSSNVLRRLFGNASGQSTETIKLIEKLAKLYKLKQGQNIAKEANFAVVAEEVAGVKPPTSLTGQVDIPTKAGVVGKAIKLGAEKVVGTPTENLLRLLNLQQGSSLLRRGQQALQGSKTLQSIANIGR